MAGLRVHGLWRGKAAADDRDINYPPEEGSTCEVAGRPRSGSPTGGLPFAPFESPDRVRFAPLHSPPRPSSLN